MKIPRATLFSIEIDKLTNSIENVVTGEILATAIVPVSADDLKTTIKRTAGVLIGGKKSGSPCARFTS